MSDRVLCPVCGAAVREAEIVRVDGEASEWEPVDVESPDPRIGPVYARTVATTVVGCTVCAAGRAN